MSIPLVTTVGSNSYRLDAVFVIDGPGGTTTLATNDDERVLSTTLPAGAYDLLLRSFTLSKDDGAGSFHAVPAIVESNHRAFTVFANSTTTISFQFVVNGAGGQPDEGGAGGAAGEAGTGGQSTGSGGTGTNATGGTSATGGAGTTGGDACAGVSCSGHGTCSQSDGHAACSCEAGYAEAPGEPTSCVDVDECATRNGSCDSLVTCTNLPGGFACGACPPGYDGTGDTGCTPRSCDGAPDASCACIKVAPDGDDASGAASGGVLPFADIAAAVEFASTHREHAAKICVAAGSECEAGFTYRSSTQADGGFAMRSGISVYGQYESTGWTRCTGREVYAPSVSFGADVAAPTLLDGFSVFTVTVDGAAGAALANVGGYALSVVNAGVLDVSGGQFTTASAVDARLSLDGVWVTDTVDLESAPGSAVKHGRFAHLSLVGNADGDVISDNTGGDATVSSCAGSLTIAGNELAASNLSGAGSAIGLEVSGSCSALIDSNDITSTGGDGVDNTALGCAAPCTIRNNAIGVGKVGDFYNPGAPAPDRGTVLALDCAGCVEVTGNTIGNAVPFTDTLHLRAGYAVEGASISGGSTPTFVAKNQISSGCGDDSVGLRVSGARVENNIIQGGCFRPSAIYVLTSRGVIAEGATDLDSNLIASPSPSSSPGTSTGLLVVGTTLVRNNIIGGNWHAVDSYVSDATFIANDAELGTDFLEHPAEKLNAYPGSFGNFEDYCGAGSSDWHLAANSPCVDAGTPEGAPLDDLDGDPRDARPDVGPDEWVAGAASATTTP